MQSWLNIQITPEQKQRLQRIGGVALIAFIVAGLTLGAGYAFFIAPQINAQQARLEQIRNELGLEAVTSPASSSASSSAPYPSAALPVPLPTSVRYDYSTSPILIKQTGIDAVRTWNGSGISLYSDAGKTLKFRANGATGELTTGNTTVNGTLVVTGTQTFTGTSTFNAATTINNNATITGTLTLAGASFTGPIKYGVATSKANNSTITHGMGTTPTACWVTPSTGYTATVTSISSTTITLGTSGTVPSVYWACGK